MGTRRFVFEIPAKVTIGIQAETEAEAWLAIKSQQLRSFSAKVHDADFIAPVSNGTRWVGCEPDYQQAALLGKEVPRDESYMMG